MAFAFIAEHPSGDVLVRSQSGQVRWLRCGKWRWNDDNTISRLTFCKKRDNIKAQRRKEMDGEQ